MKTMVACYKWVADESDIRVEKDGTVDFGKARSMISEYDKNAIETAMQAAKALDGKAVALSFGSDAVKQSLKDALSRGPEAVYWINGGKEAALADGSVTGKALAAGIKAIEDVALVVCAEGASDTYARQTPARIGAVLDWPVVTSVIALEFFAEKLVATRKLENDVEKLVVSFPVVIGVLPEIYPAPLPGLKAVMSAGKKPVTEFNATELGLDLQPKSKVVALKGYIMDRKNNLFDEGSAAEKVEKLVAAMKKDGVLS